MTRRRTVRGVRAMLVGIVHAAAWATAAQADEPLRRVIIGETLSIEVPASWYYWPRESPDVEPDAGPVRIAFDWQQAASNIGSGFHRLFEARDTVRLVDARQGVQLTWDRQPLLAEAQVRAAVRGNQQALGAIARVAQGMAAELKASSLVRDVRVMSASDRAAGALDCVDILVRYTNVREGIATVSRHLSCPDAGRELRLVVWAAPAAASADVRINRIADSLHR